MVVFFPPSGRHEGARTCQPGAPAAVEAISVCSCAYLFWNYGEATEVVFVAERRGLQV